MQVHRLGFLCLMALLSFITLSTTVVAQNSITVSNAATGGGQPVAADFDCSWTIDPQYKEVEITFQLIRDGEVIAGSGAFYYQSSGHDRFDITFGTHSAQVGDEIRATAIFSNGVGGTDVLVSTTTTVQ